MTKQNGKSDYHLDGLYFRIRMIADGKETRHIYIFDLAAKSPRSGLNGKGIRLGEQADCESASMVR